MYIPVSCWQAFTLGENMRLLSIIHILKRTCLLRVALVRNASRQTGFGSQPGLISSSSSSSSSSSMGIGIWLSWLVCPWEYCYCQNWRFLSLSSIHNNSSLCGPPFSNHLPHAITRPPNPRAWHGALAHRVRSATMCLFCWPRSIVSLTFWNWNNMVCYCGSMCSLWTPLPPKTHTYTHTHTHQPGITRYRADAHKRY